MRSDDDALTDLDELRAMLEAHEGPAEVVPRPANPRGRLRRLHPSPRRSLRPGFGVAVGALALLVGSGLGFGVGSAVTPSGSATPSAGTGFLPARGWTVVQSGRVTATSAARAIASNVSVRAGDALASAPAETAASLPARGILIDAIFSTRGYPLEDFKFTSATLPLQMASAVRVEPDTAPGTASAARYRLRAGVGAYNIDARIFFGSAEPTERQLAAAQRQLSRLVVVAERVTLVARPLVVAGLQPAIVFGTVSSGREDETVTLQAKDCGQRSFTGVEAVRTHAGGTYTIEFNRGITTTIRAMWRGVASVPVTIRQQARVEFLRLGSGRYSASVVGRASLWRKQVQIQRRQGGSWKTVKTVVLSDSGAAPGSPYVWNVATFPMKVPRGSLLRAVMPLSQARPCYLAGASRTLQT